MAASVGKGRGRGRASKAEENKLFEKLEDASDDIIAKMKEMAINGDKEMIKLYMGYMYGNPKVKTENETNLEVTGVSLRDIVSFDDDVLFNDIDLN